MRAAMLDKIRSMFAHAYDGYYYHAWPDGELLPLSCTGTNFSLIELPALTAIDALDTFWIMGNTTELVRIVERLRALQNSLGTSLWNVDKNVSLFETTIRVLGGLLSAHQILVDEPTILWQHEIWDPITGQVLDGRSDPHYDRCTVPPPLVCAGIVADYCWTGQPTASSCEAVNATRGGRRRPATTATYHYDGFLLDSAIDIGNRLLPAFSTATGIPYGTVHLQFGVPPGETPVASLAGAGTLVLEWELLSQLSGNPIYGKAARLAARALWKRQSVHRLVGKHIDSRTGNWVESLSGIGSNSDSFIEYLVKYGFVFLEDHDFSTMWRTIYEGVYQYMRKGDWYVDTDYQSPSHSRSVLESLMAFFPGLQVWLGEWGPAARSLNAFFVVREFLGFLPERFSLSSWRADGPTYPLRPELFESNYLMHRAVKDFAFPSPFSNHSSSSGWLWAAAWSVEKLAKLQTTCGFATLLKVDPSTTGRIVDEVSTWKSVDDMPSFFLSETLKYLYLTFDEENPLHTDDDRQWMFTTEAHPIHTPVKETSRNDLLRLEQILLQRRRGRKAPRPAGSVASDQWSEKTTFKEYLNQLWSTELEIKKKVTSTRSRGSFFFQERDLFFQVDEAIDLHDEWDEFASRQNLAHLKLSASGVGSGLSLRSSCPNFHSSELLWIHALNGDSFDFVDDFIPVDNQNDQQKASRRGVVYGSVEALDHLYMQYTPAQLGESGGCLIRDLGKTSLGKEKREKPQQDGTVRFESDFGIFHVTPAGDGMGFIVSREDDGHTLNVSFLNGDEDSQDIVESVMVHSYGGSDDSWRGQVSVADLDGHSLLCQVSLLRILRDDSISGGVDEEEILRVPCTPGMFGPAHLSNLISSDGASVRAPVYLPPALDEKGCQSSLHFSPTSKLDGEAVCMNTNIQMLRRGDCSFMTKALNQRLSRDSDAVVIINTADELFTMAGNPEMDTLDPTETPLSVMVSKSHGENLAAVLSSELDGQEKIIGKVALTLQPSIEELSSKTDRSSLQFPLVYASQSVIQIYAEGFWGIQASEVEGSWNLQLVGHRLG